MPIHRTHQSSKRRAAEALCRAVEAAAPVARPVEALERRVMLTAAPAAAATDPNFNQPAGQLGINLNNNDNYRPAALWLDVRKYFSDWQYSNSSGAVSGADLTTFGYPSGTAASNNAYANTSLVGYPDGNYALQYQGAGTITFSGMGSLVASSRQYNAATDTTTALVTINHNLSGLLTMTASGLSAADPLHDLHLMMPGYSPNTTQVFNPETIQRLTPFGTIRFMDAFQTNNNLTTDTPGISGWSLRTTPEDFSYTTDTGIAYEDAIALANATHSNVWWNVPVNATDAYVINLADMLKYGSDANGNPYTSTQANPVYAPLNAGLKIHIEYVNELWNSFNAANQNLTNATANPALDHTLPNLRGQQEIFRLHQIYTDFGQVYGASLASNVGFIFSGDNNGDGVVSDFVKNAFQFAAENPSWGAPSSWLEAFTVSDYVDLKSNQKPPTDLTSLFNNLNSDITSNIATAITAMANYAHNTLGLPLYGYEGGQNLSPAGTSLDLQAQTDPRMATFYQNLLDNWYADGGSLFVHYSYIDVSGQFGSWGLLNNAGLTGSPKWDGVIKRLVPMGDANLDGSTNFNDFLILKQYWGTASGAFWQQGDFNADGKVNAADLSLLNANIDTSGFTAAQLAEYNNFVQTSGTGSSVGTGLTGTYYAGTSFTTAVLSRVDPTIDFTWLQGGTGPDPSVGQANFSAKWTGTLEAPTTETYTFHTKSDDGIRLIINGQTVIDDLTGGQHEDIGQIALVAGQKYSIEVDYFQNFGNGLLDLQWQTPTIPAVDIPTTMLTPTQVTPIVTVAATTPTAVANGASSTPGVFTFSRTGSLASSLAVNYAISGNAVGGTDYTTISGTVTFAANSATATVNIAPLTTPLDPVPDNVIVTVLPDTVNNTYVAGVQSAATVSITETIGIAGWSEQDIGGPSPAGAAHFDGTQWMMAAGGSDISGTADQFALASQSLSGNFSTVAQVTGLTDPGSGYSKAGVIIRASNDPGAAYAAVLATPANGIFFQWRTTQGGGTLLWQASGLASSANWVKISRVGSVFTAYYSADGQTWTPIGSPQTITMASPVLAGLALTSHQQGTSATATFKSVATTPFAAAPAGFTAASAAGQINLAWSATSGATGYNVYRSQTPGGEGTTPYAQIASGSTVSYPDSATTPGVTYYYTLTALNSAGEGAATAEKSAAATAVVGAPAAPVASATPAGGQVVLTWTNVATATAYTIYRGTTSGAEGTTPIATGITAPAAGKIVSFADTLGQPGTTYFYTVTATNSFGSSVVSAEVSASPAVAPAAPLSDTDIGSPANAGSASYGSATGVWTVKGGGADIWNGSDQFNFASETVTGDDTLVARVASLINTDQNAKAGLMFRTDTSAGSAFVDLLVTAGGNVSLQYRSSNPGGAGAVGGVSASAPTWLKLVRSGDNFTAYSSADGVAWTLVATRTVALGTTVQAGLAVTAHNNSALTTATFTNVSLGAAPTITTPATSVLNAASTAATLSVAATTLSSSPLSYKWSIATLPAGVTVANAPTFSAANGTATGNTVTATFKRSGTYVFLVSVADANGAVATSPVCVVVKQIANTLSILPASPATVAAGATQAFTVTGVDQFAQPLVSPTIAWSLLGTPTGSINAVTGVYTAGAAGTSDTVQASANSGALTATATVSVPATISQLTGTASANTTLSYDGVSNYLKAFDGNTSTSFDAPTANGNWIQLDLGAAATIASIKYAPRVGFEYRMSGGMFQASNDPSFATSVTLYTVSGSPADGLTSRTVNPGATYRYVRYTSPAGSYGNIAEFQVFGTAGTIVADTTAPSIPTLLQPASSATSSSVSLTWTASTDNVAVDHYIVLRNGSPIGNTTTNSYTDNTVTASTLYSYTVEAVDAATNTSLPSTALAVTTPAAATITQLTGTASANTTLSYDGVSNYLKAFDGNTGTVFDAPTANGNWIQLDLGAPATLTSISYAPRVNFEYRMTGGVFQASNDPSFATSVTLYTVSGSPADGLTSRTVSPGATYRYMRYTSPVGSYGNIAEFQVFGTAGTIIADTTAPSIPTLLQPASPATSSSVSLTWTASTDNVAVDHYIVLRNGNPIGNTTTNSYTDNTVAASTLYSYTVEAVDAATNTSLPSTALAVTTPAAATITQLTGTASANTTLSYDGVSNYLKAFDGNTSTSFDAPTGNGNWIQLDLGAAATLTSISYAPRQFFESRMSGGVFQASNDPSFATSVTLYTVSGSPADGLTSRTVSPGATYRYVRYTSPAGSYGNIAEFQVFGTAGTIVADTTAPSIPTLLQPASPATSSSVSLTWTASTDNVGVDHYIVLRNGSPIGNTTTNSYTDNTVAASTLYNYTVEAVDAATNTSLPSTALAVTTPAAATITQLTGTASANTTQSYDGVSNYLKAFDGNTNTSFDAPTGNGNWLALNLGSAKTITQIKFAPRVGFEYRMVGGIFQVASDANFTNPITVYTIGSTPPDGLNTVALSLSSKYQYIRYLAPANSYGNIAEFQVFGS